MKFPIGVIIDSFRTDIPTAVGKAAKVGAQGIQVYATSGEMSPEELVGSKRADFRRLVEDNGLVISALCGDLGGGFGNRDENGWRVEKSKRIIELAKELGTDIVTTHIGVVPEDSGHERYKIMQDACFEPSRFASCIILYRRMRALSSPASRTASTPISPSRRDPRPRRRSRSFLTRSALPASRSTSTPRTLSWSRATTPQRRSTTCATT